MRVIMKCLGPLWIVWFFSTQVTSMPTQETTTRRASSPPIGDTIKVLTNQLMDINATSVDMMLDTRTPPKVKQQMKNANKPALIENSHPGIAVPMNEDDLVLEESTKKFNFYKIEPKSTTDSGISTWVLLNSHTVPPYSTSKVTRKPTVKPKPEDGKNMTAVDAEIYNKITKPIFKKRTTTTKRPTTLTTITASNATEKLTKVKASVLNNAINIKNKTQNAASKGGNATTHTKPPKTQSTTVSYKPALTNELWLNDSSLVPLESKDGGLELFSSSSKPTRRPTTKRKKNKNKRRRPAVDRIDTANNTKLVTKVNQKQKPIGTQIYNYLSREIMPTVGVGLVGLMVTAGLASYFFYPFTPVRRSYDVDRKDKEGSYYYNNDYTGGGVAEEEVIGKVIAGMPDVSNAYQNNRVPTSRGVYPELNQALEPKYKPQPHAQGSVETVHLTPAKQYSEEVVESSFAAQRNHKPDSYYSGNAEVFEHSKETGYTVDDRHFVVGNIPKEFQEVVTPAVVPEHGPRSMRTRHRRSEDFRENEISNDDAPLHANEIVKEGTVTTISPNMTDSSVNPQPTKPTFIDLLNSLLEIKLRLGLELFHNTTQTMSRYISEVRQRLNSHYVLNREQPMN